ncbi:FHF complex subunit HOOK interacting protein 2A-like isoform X2 [Glandiceps talaboti]
MKLAPTLSLKQDFVYHWKSVTHYFIDNKDDTIPVGETNISSHLEQMLDILTQEESECEENQTGPCMEYLLQHKILDTLYALGKADCPSGMKQVVFTFFTNLLGKIQQPILPHINVHGPVKRLIKVCGQIKAGPTENEEVQFLCMVCAKLRQDPYLVNFFLEAPKSSHNYIRIKTKPQKNAPASSYKCEVGEPEFELVMSLLALLQSPDTRIAVKAGEGLMLVTSLPEPNAAKCVVEHTQFCEQIAERLCALYNKLPVIMDPVDVDTVDVTWGLDMYSADEDDNMFPGKRALISLLSWFDYCDELIKNAHIIIGRALAKDIRHRFFEAILEPLLLQASEVGILTSTAHLIRFVRMINSQALLSEAVYFMLGDGTEKETPGESMGKLRHRFVERIDHLSDEICIVSLKLFEVLLLKPHEHIINNLVLRNLQSRTYHAPPGMESTDQSNTSELDTDDDALSDRPDSPMFDDSDLPPIGLSRLDDLPFDFPEIRVPELDSAIMHNHMEEYDDHVEMPDFYVDELENGVLENELITNKVVDSTVPVDTKTDFELDNERDSASVPKENTTGDSVVGNDAKAANDTMENGDEIDTADKRDEISDNETEVVDDKAENAISEVIGNNKDVDSVIANGVVVSGHECVQEPVEQTMHAAGGTDVQTLAAATSYASSNTASLASGPVSMEVVSNMSGSVHVEEKAEIHSVVRRYLSLVPEYAKSSPPSDSSYDTYLRDAHRQFRECSVQCLRWDWPTYPKALDRVEYDEAFYEGFFLKVLFDKISQMLDQPYEVNLQLTSVIAKLSQFPHPHIHEYFLNPFTKTAPGCRCLYTVLARLMSDLKGRVKTISDFQLKCVQVRKQLTEMEDEDSSPQIELMEGVIVLEEFFKELAAIAFVKAHAESGRI